jgi:amylosucrase
VFNFSAADAWLTWYAFRQHGMRPARLHDHWTGRDFEVGADHEYLVLQPYGFHLLEPA